VRLTFHLTAFNVSHLPSLLSLLSLLVALAAVSLSGCGQKGGLYMPQNPAPQHNAPPDSSPTESAAGDSVTDEPPAGADAGGDAAEIPAARQEE
jgi:predicted small lipoprotein YifL